MNPEDYKAKAAAAKKAVDEYREQEIEPPCGGDAWAVWPPLARGDYSVVKAKSEQKACFTCDHYHVEVNRKCLGWDGIHHALEAGIDLVGAAREPEWVRVMREEADVSDD